jgi:hypothetical protein
MEDYVQGFMAKCAEAGIDPEELAKYAERFIPGKKYPAKPKKPAKPAKPVKGSKRKLPTKPPTKVAENWMGKKYKVSKKKSTKKPAKKTAADDYGDALSTGGGRGLAAGAGIGAGIGGAAGFQAARLPSSSISSALLKGLAGTGIGAAAGAPLGALTAGVPLAIGGAGIAALLHALFGKDKDNAGDTNLPNDTMPYTEDISSDNIDYGDTT